MRASVTLAILVIALCLQTVIAQDSVQAAFSGETGTPAIGEPFHLTLTVRVPVGAIVTLPQFPEEWSPFMVKSVGDVSESTQGNTQIYQQTLTVILWQPGDYRTPETQVIYQLPNSPQPAQITIESAYFTVPSVLKEDDLTLRPPKPPVGLPYFPLWLPLILVALGAGTGCWAWSKGWIRKPDTGRDAVSTIHVSAQRALRDLKRIAEKVSTPTDIYAQSADCLRLYLQGRFAVDAADLTTDEIRGILEAQSILPDRRQRELEHLLERADLVKFARLQPTLTSAQHFITAAQRWVQFVEQAAGSENE
jgi:hypothetical protein